MTKNSAFFIASAIIQYFINAQGGLTKFPKCILCVCVCACVCDYLNLYLYVNVCFFIYVLIFTG